MNTFITNDTLSISVEGVWSDDNLTDNSSTQSTDAPKETLFNSTIFTNLGWGDAALVSLFISIIAGTVAGNALVIAAVATTRRLRTVTNCFVMSLAVADWLVGMFVMPPKVALYLVDNQWKLGSVTCELWISLDILLCTASILSLCAISIDRYLAITRPLAYSRRRRSKRLALSMISCVWVAAVVITSPPIFGWYDSNRNTDNRCEYNENTGYVVYSALGSFFLPLLVMLYVYARIACVIAHRQKTMQKLHNSSDRFDSTRCCPNEAEEPLRHIEIDMENDNVRDEPARDLRARNIGSTASTNNAPTTATTDFGTGSNDHQQQSTVPTSSNSANIRGNPSSNLNQSSFPTQETKDDDYGTKSFWGKLGLNSCTKGNSNRSSSGSHGKPTKNQRSYASGTGQGSGNMGSSDSESNSATIAISIPHPSTLAGSTVEGMGGGAVGQSDCDVIGPSGSSPGNLHLHHRHLPNIHHMSRMRTGSRLCHHSVITTSPQRSIHRVHEATRVFVEDEVVTINANQRMEIPRVWTIEQPAIALSSLAVDSAKKFGSSMERLESFSQSELDLRIQRRRGSSYNGLGGSVGECASTSNISGGAPCTSSSIAARGIVSGPDSSARSCDNIGGRGLGVTRFYQSHSVRGGDLHQHGPHANHQIHTRRHGQQAQSSINVSSGGPGTSRRSIKVNLGVQSNQEGNREYTSGRVASFKRETKTARTLAAVVGGFIICWLPFFVAYVIGPFMPSRDCIPTALMDALIWLGWGNSAINPLIYSFYSADFRSAFWRLTIHKCEGLLRKDSQRSSPRKYDDNIQLRLSRA